MSFPNIIEGVDPKNPSEGWVIVNGRGHIRRVVRIEPLKNSTYDVVYEALRPHRPTRNLESINISRVRWNKIPLKNYEHVCFLSSWKSWVGKGKGKAVVLSDWSDDQPIPVMIGTDQLLSWMKKLEKADDRLEEIAIRLLNAGLDPNEVLNGDGKDGFHYPLFASGGEIGSVHGDIHLILLAAGVSDSVSDKSTKSISKNLPQALAFSDLERSVLLKALNSFIRIHLGQAVLAFGPLINHLIANCTDEDLNFKTDRICGLLKEAQVAITGIAHGGPGLYNPKVANEARVARRIEATLKGEDDVLRLSSRSGEVISPRAQELQTQAEKYAGTEHDAE
jgi:hypothetical protein